MNILQGLKTQRHYCVSLNPRQHIDDQHVVQRLVYDHPVFNFTALQSQSRLSQLNQGERVKFCGSYFGYGFHEDAVCAASRAVESLGVAL